MAYYAVVLNIHLSLSQPSHWKTSPLAISGVSCYPGKGCVTGYPIIIIFCFHSPQWPTDYNDGLWTTMACWQGQLASSPLFAEWSPGLRVEEYGEH